MPRAERSSGEAVRLQICQFLRANPGAHFRDIQRSLALSPGQAVHHLRRLSDGGLVVARRSTRYTHYFPAGTPQGPRSALGALRQPSRRAVALRIHGDGPQSLRELADATGCATSTLHHHLRVMLEAGVLLPEGPRPVRYHLAPGAVEALHVLARDRAPEPADAPAAEEPPEEFQLEPEKRDVPPLTA